jgi:hypothetical protein
MPVATDALADAETRNGFRELIGRTKWGKPANDPDPTVITYAFAEDRPVIDTQVYNQPIRVSTFPPSEIYRRILLEKMHELEAKVNLRFKRVSQKDTPMGVLREGVIPRIHARPVMKEILGEVPIEFAQGSSWQEELGFAYLPRPRVHGEDSSMVIHSGLAEKKASGVIAHELGHMLGLVHPRNFRENGTVMHSLALGDFGSDDIAALQAMYGVSRQQGGIGR